MYGINSLLCFYRVYFINLKFRSFLICELPCLTRHISPWCQPLPPHAAMLCAWDQRPNRFDQRPTDQPKKKTLGISSGPCSLERKGERGQFGDVWSVWCRVHVGCSLVLQLAAAITFNQRCGSKPLAWWCRMFVMTWWTRCGHFW